jgi:hypothetical protein
MTKSTQIPGAAGDQEKGEPRKGTSLSLVQNMMLREKHIPDYLREGRLHLTPLFSRPVSILFDSGAVQGNFVSGDLGEWIRFYQTRNSNGKRDLGNARETAAKRDLGTLERVKFLPKISKQKMAKFHPIFKPTVSFDDTVTV